MSSKGIDVSYSLNSKYFEVGCAYQMHLGTNNYKIGLLVKYSKDEVTFKILKDRDGDIVDLTLTVDQLRFRNYGLIKMKPDYINGKFSDD